MHSLRHGEGELPLPAVWSEVEVVAGEEPPPLPDPAAAVARALERPLGQPGLSTFVEPGDRVAIVVPDATRFAAPALIVPPIVEAVRRAGASSVEIRIANGTHRRSRPEEIPALIGGVDVPAGDRDCDDPEAHEALGKVAGLGVVRIDRQVARADKLVLVGAIGFHYLAGFGGGGKLVAPGCADRATALAIHRRCLAEPGPGRHPAAIAGRLEGNPLQEAIAEVLALAPPAFLVQVALQKARRPAGIFTGDVRAAHRAAAAHQLRWLARPVGPPADLVIASAGGSPWDIDLYQAHKSLEAACRAVRPGGTVVLVAACTEGAGSGAFADSLRHPTPDEHEAALRRSFSIAGHTALALRRKTAAARCILVGAGIDAALARGLGFEPAADLEEAAALAGPADRALLLPDGARTLPIAEGESAAERACTGG